MAKLEAKLNQLIKPKYCLAQKNSLSREGEQVLLGSLAVSEFNKVMAPCHMLQANNTSIEQRMVTFTWHTIRWWAG